MNTQVKINGQNYTIDLEKAIEQGLITPSHEQIVAIRTGDIFRYSTGEINIIMPDKYYSSKTNKRWSFIGLGLKKACHNSSPLDYFITPALSTDDMIEYLNQHQYTYIGNIDNDLRELFATKYSKV